MNKDFIKSYNEEIDAPDSAKGPIPFLIRFFKGLLVGIGAILPGLSGGVLAVIFGLYQPLIRFLSNIRNKFLAHVRYFLPVGLGAMAGILIFSIFVEKAFGRYSAQFVCLFLGFVIGTLPSLYRTAGKEGRDKGDYIIMAISAIFIFALMFIGSDFPQIEPNMTVWFFSGALVALGFIVPGMSPSNFLIYFGLYDKMAASITALDFSMLISFGLGGIVCVLLFSKLVGRAFERHYSKMYHAILGMVIGSSAGIVPAIIMPAYSKLGLEISGLSLPVALIFGLVMLFLGIIGSYQFSKLEEKVSNE